MTPHMYQDSNQGPSRKETDVFDKRQVVDHCTLSFLSVTIEIQKLGENH